MKFWQKIFLGTLLLFIAAFNIGTFFLVSYSYNFSLQRETDSSIHEQAVILSSIEENIVNANKIFVNASEDNEHLRAIIEPLANYYKNQGVYLSLYNGEAIVYSNTPDSPDSIMTIERNDKNIVNQKINGRRYLFVASQIPQYNHLKLLYVRDINTLDDYRFNISRVFIMISAMVCLILGIANYILLKRLTHPINKLNVITSEIANGAYGRRVNIDRNDEFGELGRTFNIMAGSVEDKIQKLTRSDQDKQQFIDNLSHELKTPLTSILGYSAYLQNAMSDEGERIKAAGHLRDSTERLKNLSDKLLDIIHIRSEDIELKEIDIETLFISLENIFLPSFHERNLKLEINLNIKSIIGDETLLLSLLTNLVENAARASTQNQIIKVWAYEEDYPIIEVSDSGSGMDDSEIVKITNPFYRIDKSRSRAFGGVGLGLSICKQIAELHHAKLEVTSQQGIGTSVKIIFTSR